MQFLECFCTLKIYVQCSSESSQCDVVVDSCVTVTIFCFQDSLPLFGLGSVMHLDEVVFVPILLGCGNNFGPEG